MQFTFTKKKPQTTELSFNDIIIERKSDRTFMEYLIPNTTKIETLFKQSYNYTDIESYRVYGECFKTQMINTGLYFKFCIYKYDQQDINPEVVYIDEGEYDRSTYFRLTEANCKFIDYVRNLRKLVA